MTVFCFFVWIIVLSVTKGRGTQYIKVVSFFSDFEHESFFKKSELVRLTLRISKTTKEKLKIFWLYFAKLKHAQAELR